MRFPLYILTVCLVSFGILLGGCGNDTSTSSSSTTPVAESTPKSTASISDARNTPVVQAAKKVGPAVVGITNKAVARDWFNRKVEVDKGTGSVLFSKVMDIL